MIQVELKEVKDSIKQLEHAPYDKLRDLIISKLDSVFKSEPADAVSLWSKVKPLTVEQIQKYTHKIDKAYNVVDLESASFKNWSHPLILGQKITGMATDSGLRHTHGAYRHINPKTWVREGSGKDNCYHGFVRQIFEDKIGYLLYASPDDKVLAEVWFDQDLAETHRNDPDGLLEEILTDTIKR